MPTPLSLIRRSAGCAGRDESTDGFELKRRQQNRLLRVENAFKAIKDGSYGECSCGKEIHERWNIAGCGGLRGLRLKGPSLAIVPNG